MFDDDDDGVEPQFKEVDQYYFEDDGRENVCFSILPLQFDEDDEVPSCGFEMKVYLPGRANKTDEIHKRVVAWRIKFESEQPDILLLSEGNWIKLLKPRTVYTEKIFRSTLITHQMLWFVRKHPMGINHCGSLFDHINEIFSKFALKPTVHDFRNQYSLIKLFTEKDHVLMSSNVSYVVFTHVFSIPSKSPCTVLLKLDACKLSVPSGELHSTSFLVSRV